MRAFARAFIAGAMLGDGIAVVFMYLEWIGQIGRYERAWFRLCPFYALGFSSFVHLWFALVFWTLVGNAILYGVPALILYSLYRFGRWIVGRVAGTQQGPPPPVPARF